MFFSLCCSAIALWIFRKQKSDFNPLIICFGVFIGFLASVLTITQVNTYNRSIGAASLFVLGTTLLLVSFFVILLFFIFSALQKSKEEIFKLAKETGFQCSIVLLIYLFPFTLIFIAAIFLACQFPIHKPSSYSRRLLYGSSLTIAFLIIYLMVIQGNFPPGTLVPNNLRYEWGIKNFPYDYESEGDRLKICELITNSIGEVKATALVEDNNVFHGSFTPGDGYSMFTLELIGEKGTAIAKTCSSLRCPRTKFISKIRSRSGTQEIDISSCLNLNFGEF
ncbi:hypothetical protein HC931_08620 [Candidatus Gracilibacteria bacterium]|nr:hypothetical protein [Candidatus Gracilibacteria bacterium]